jgi:hypothetical protein
MFLEKGKVSAFEFEWHVEQQLRRAIQHQSSEHKLAESAFPDQFGDQPVSVP